MHINFVRKSNWKHLPAQAQSVDAMNFHKWQHLLPPRGPETNKNILYNKYVFNLFCGENPARLYT